MQIIWTGLWIFICKDRGLNEVLVFGYCTGGIISLMYTSLHPEESGKAYPAGNSGGFFQVV